MFQFNSKSYLGALKKNDQLTKLCLTSLASLSGIVLVLIFYFLFKESLTSISSIGLNRFAFDRTWLPELDIDNAQFGLSILLLSSLLVAAFSILLAAPFGWLVSIYIVYFSSGLKKTLLLKVTEILAGLPSVVLGLWGIVVVVPLLLRIQAPGLSLLAGALVLGVMILPTIIISSINAYELLAEEYQFNSSGLGISKSSFILMVASPLAWPGIAAGIVLALARALGETMVVLMVCGNVIQFPSSMFDPIRTLTGNIALELSYAYGSHQSALFFSAFLLLLVVSLLLGIVELIKYSGNEEVGYE